MAASISDVAAHAGVSVATVSRAMRGLPNVAPSTRNRVLAAAAELHYVVDPHASRLAAGRTQTIGMIVPLFTQWFYNQVVAGAEGVLAAADHDLLLYNVAGTATRELFLQRLPFRKRVDGIIVVALPLSQYELCALADTGTPITTVGLGPGPVPSVTVDNTAAGAVATRHLINLGHERIGLISSLADDPLHLTAPEDRRAGYRRALADAGLELRSDLDVPGNFSYDGGAKAMAQLLATDRPPTAVFAESDEMAVGALRTVRDAGLRVPHDISVIGFDDNEVARQVGLTTVAQPAMAQGEVAANLLLEQLEPTTQKPPGDEPTRVVLPTRLQVRTTTGPRRTTAEPALSAQ